MLTVYRESEKPRCPFCAEPFERPPREIPKDQGDFFKWQCACGAVGAYDVTGHNLGDALLEALAFAYGNNLETALSMEAGEDYDIEYVDNYQPSEHRVFGGHPACRSGLAGFVFVRLKTLKHLH